MDEDKDDCGGGGMDAAELQRKDVADADDAHAMQLQRVAAARSTAKQWDSVAQDDIVTGVVAMFARSDLLQHCKVRRTTLVDKTSCDSCLYQVLCELLMVLVRRLILVRLRCPRVRHRMVPMVSTVLQTARARSMHKLLGFFCTCQLRGGPLHTLLLCVRPSSHVMFKMRS